MFTKRNNIRNNLKRIFYNDFANEILRHIGIKSECEEY